LKGTRGIITKWSFNTLVAEVKTSCSAYSFTDRSCSNCSVGANL